MRIDEIETRKAEIRSLLDAEGAELDIDALTEEVRALDAEAEEIRANAAKEAELRNAVAATVTAEITSRKGEKNMENIEVRNSQQYIAAFANYIRTGKDEECRTLISANGTTGSGLTGSVPVPDFVANAIRHAWDNEQIMALVRKTSMRGNVKIGFEKTAPDAVAHTEGADAPDAEALELGIRSLIPASIKKWIKISDEAVDLGGEEFLNYIYGEITYKIAKKAADLLVADIIACPTTSSATLPAVPEITANAIAMTTCATALGQLSDEATDPVIIMNKATYAAFKAVQYATGYGPDPFEGMKVLFNNSLPAFSSASVGNTYAIVGDLSNGAQANMPNGDEVNVKYDDLSLAEYDLVKLVGREFVGLGVVAPFHFCKIKK